MVARRYRGAGSEGGGERVGQAGVTLFPGNRANGLDTIQGGVLLCGGRDGRPLALLGQAGAVEERQRPAVAATAEQDPALDRVEPVRPVAIETAPDGASLLLMPAWTADYVGIKILTLFPGNRANGNRVRILMPT
jgi:ornithine cyclodeaminase/alanine dehydrogenase-like protein (mu-crystallin family)